jgi:hypothetical protein
MSSLVIVFLPLETHVTHLMLHYTTLLLFSDGFNSVTAHVYLSFAIFNRLLAAVTNLAETYRG